MAALNRKLAGGYRPVALTEVQPSINGLQEGSPAVWIAMP
jgi:hypothetical protein